MIRLTFDHPSPDKRTLGSFALFNGGNVDAYVTRVELTAKDNMFDCIGEATFRLYEPLKQGEGFEHDIAYQGAQFRSQVSLQPIILNSETYPRAKAAIKQEGLPLDPCISLFPFNARLGLNAPEDGSFRNANALARLDGTVFFLDRGNPDKEHPSDIRGLYIEAAVMLEPRCLNRLGGREKVVELLAN